LTPSSARRGVLARRPSSRTASVASTPTRVKRVALRNSRNSSQVEARRASPAATEAVVTA
jgi:hypothetical protein